METDRTSFHQRRLRSLYSQTVECRCTVEQYRVFLDDIFKNVPYFILHTFDLTFGILIFVAISRSTSSFMTKGLKSSSAISLGRPHWYILREGPTTITERPE